MPLIGRGAVEKVPRCLRALTEMRTAAVSAAWRGFMSAAWQRQLEIRRAGAHPGTRPPHRRRLQNAQN
jgi:hypothetical protein